MKYKALRTGKKYRARAPYKWMQGKHDIVMLPWWLGKNIR